MSGDHPVVLFDGVCNFCNGTVNWLIDHDPDGILRFATLQSEWAARFFAAREPPDGRSGTIVFVERDVVSDQSTAVARILRHLPGLRWLGTVLLRVPRPVRDGLYGAFASRRYAWFGRRPECRIPEPGVRERFLE